MKIVFLLVLTTIITSQVVSAQDTHYWNLQYGTRSRLLGGTVIGSVSDLGATYYNPGALALFDDPGFILSSRVYQYDSYTLEGGGGEGVDLPSTSFSPSPSLVAGSFSRKNHHLAFSILTRQAMDVGVEGRFINSIDAIPGSPGDEEFAGELTFEQDLNELWGGFTWSYKLKPRIGIGVTQYVAIRSQNSRIQTVAQAMTDSDMIAATILINDFDYRNYRTLWKTGLGFNLEPLTFGITMTTPSLNLTGKGSTLTNRSVIGQDTDGDGIEDPEFSSDFQQDVDAKYKSPWSLGAGAAYKTGKSRIHFSLEWFSAVDKYDVLDSRDFQGQSSGETLTNEVTHELESVLNYGIGIEHSFRERLTAYGSFVTDFSAAVEGTDTNLSFSNWDLYHITGGMALTINRVEMILGLTYSFGNQVIDRPASFTGSNESNELIGSAIGADVDYTGLKFILGFSFTRQGESG